MQQVSRTALPPRTTNSALDYLGGGVWRLWLHTPDFVHGTYLKLYSCGKIIRVVSREDEGDEEFVVKETGI